MISHGILFDCSSSLDGRDEKERKDRWMSRSSLTLGVDSTLIFMDHDVYSGLTPHPRVRSLQSMKQSPSLMTDILVVVLVLRLNSTKCLRSYSLKTFLVSLEIETDFFPFFRAKVLSFLYSLHLFSYSVIISSVEETLR